MYMKEVDLWNVLNSYFIPSGYDLVETKEHKIERLTQNISYNKSLLESMERRTSDLMVRINEDQKELDKLKAGD